MERRGGCCIARYGGDADVAWKVGRIMMRFRPIAPKPAAGGAATGGAQEFIGGARGGGRVKRKGEGRRGRKAKRAAGAFREEERKEEAPVVTLPLMPETPERKEEKQPVSSPTASDLAVPYFQPVLQRRADQCAPGAQAVVAPRPVRPAGSWVMVECVTDTWREGQVGVGSGDEDLRRGLEEDACPAFVSDAADRVTWTNASYRRMVVGPTSEEEQEGEVDGEEEEEEEVRVALVTKGLVPPGIRCRAFTCRVRVRYACRRRGRVSMAAPCDVWRLADGRLAWRLDVKAALRLSLGS